MTRRLLLFVFAFGFLASASAPAQLAEQASPAMEAPGASAVDPLRQQLRTILAELHDRAERLERGFADLAARLAALRRRVERL